MSEDAGPRPASLRFFNALSATLHIELTQPEERISPKLMNRKAPPGASIKALSLDASVFENAHSRELTSAELDGIALEEPEVRLRGFGDVVRHVAPNGKSFTVRELLHAVEETERQTRAKSIWFGGIDTHHIFFEGITRGPDGVWTIGWGS